MRRQPWFFSSGGPGSGLVSLGRQRRDLETSAGQRTCRKEILGRIGIAVSGADSNRVYAIIEAKEGGLYRSDDGGEHWTRVNEDGRFRQRAWYFSKVYADPKSVDTVYLLNTGFFARSMAEKILRFCPRGMAIITDFGSTRTNPDRIGNASDGGASISTDGGKTWTRKTINRPRNFITSRSITRFRITFTARNRTTRTLASPAAPIPE